MGASSPTAHFLNTNIQASQKIDEAFLSILDDLSMKGIHVNANSGPNYAPTRFEAHTLAGGITKNAFRSAMRRLLESRTIESVPMTRGSFIRRTL